MHTDFTEVINRSGKYYLIVYLCHFSRVILNFYLTDSATSESAIICLKPILKRLTSSTYIHQDQGTQFTSYLYTDFLISNDLYISYSEAGTPSDNPEMESFFGRLKDEWKEIYSKTNSKEELLRVIKTAIHYYNYNRIHTSIKDYPYSFMLSKLNPSKIV